MVTDSVIERQRRALQPGPDFAVHSRRRAPLLDPRIPKHAGYLAELDTFRHGVEQDGSAVEEQSHGARACANRGPGESFRAARAFGSAGGTYEAIDTIIMCAARFVLGEGSRCCGAFAGESVRG